MTKHIHGEAFNLMTYFCKDCGHKEIIWNSRDGVTPFGCGCPSCGKTLLHSDWGKDTYAPSHKLLSNQKYWRDGTPEEAEAFMRKRIELYRDKYPISTGEAEKLYRQAREGTLSEFQKGWPMLDVAR